MIERVIKYFINRFEFAISNSGTIKVNKQDIDNLKHLIEYFNNGERNTNLEDSLILFWIFNYLHIELEDNKLIFKEHPNIRYIQVDDPLQILNRLSTRLDTKQFLMEKIHLDLLTTQQMLGLPKEKLLPIDEVEKVLNEAIEHFKTSDDVLKRIIGL